MCSFIDIFPLDLNLSFAETYPIKEGVVCDMNGIAVKNQFYEIEN